MSRDDPFDIESKLLRAELQRRRAEEEASVELADWRNLMAETWGRRIARRLLRQLGGDDGVFDGNAIAMARKAGRSDWATALRKLLERECHEAWVISLREENAEDANDRRNDFTS